MAIISALSEAADDARLMCRPDPVIVTDYHTAKALAEGIAREMGDRAFFRGVQMPPGVIAMFDGVQIRAGKPRVRVKMGRRVVCCDGCDCCDPFGRKRGGFSYVSPGAVKAIHAETLRRFRKVSKLENYIDWASF